MSADQRFRVSARPYLLTALALAVSLAAAGCNSYVATITLNTRNVDSVVLEEVTIIVQGDGFPDSYPLGNLRPGEVRLRRVQVGKQSAIDVSHGKAGPGGRLTRFTATTYLESDGQANISIDITRDRAVNVSKLDFSKRPWRELK